LNRNEQKQAVARAALQYVPHDGVIGVGSGSTADLFIDELAGIKNRLRGAVASSVKTAERLRAHGISLLELDVVEELPIYIDGADEITEQLAMIKGGGGALTREKIVAAVAGRFICIADETKLVGMLGRFPLPIEVIPMAWSYVARVVGQLGGQPRLRSGFTTDNGNLILDVSGLTISDPVRLEESLNNIAGVVTNGLFARRGADALLLGTQSGVRTLQRRTEP
jgi:ribose 5-phosphate isomerase A